MHHACMPLYLLYFASSFSIVGPTIFSDNSFKHWNPKLLLAEPDLNQLLSLDLTRNYWNFSIQIRSVFCSLGV